MLFIDMLIPPKGGPGPHSHATFQEAFYIIDGEIKLITKEKVYTATKGSYVNIPFNGPVINLPMKQIKQHTYSVLRRPPVWRKCS